MFMPSITGKGLFEDLFDGLWYGGMPEVKNSKSVSQLFGKGVMQTDIKELEDGFELVMNLPGYDKNQIEAVVDDGYLTISANTVKEEKKTSDAQDGTENDNADNSQVSYVCQERFTGSCKRRFYVGNNITKDDIKATFNNGLLTVMVPKKDKLPKEARQVVIG